VFLVGTLAAMAWLGARHWRQLVSADVGIAAVASVAFLYSFAQTGNNHHGATPSLTRYALWFIPLAIAVWKPWWRLAGRLGHRTLAVAAAASAVISIFGFHPAVGDGQREPTWLASWLWTRHPGWNNPLPEVFAETLLGAEPMRTPATTPACEKVLVSPGPEGEGVWPVPCFPAELPPQCAVPGALCYANRRGAVYDFVVAPGRNAQPRREPDRAWPTSSEPHVRKLFLEYGWSELVDEDTPLSVLRAQHDVRVARFGNDQRFIMVVRPSGPAPELHLRSALPLRGTLVDATTGTELMALSHAGPAAELWRLPLPENGGNLMVVALRALPADAAP